MNQPNLAGTSAQHEGDSQNLWHAVESFRAEMKKPAEKHAVIWNVIKNQDTKKINKSQLNDMVKSLSPDSSYLISATPIISPKNDARLECMMKHFNEHPKDNFMGVKGETLSHMLRGIPWFTTSCGNRVLTSINVPENETWTINQPTNNLPINIEIDNLGNATHKMYALAEVGAMALPELQKKFWETQSMKMDREMRAWNKAQDYTDAQAAAVQAAQEKILKKMRKHKWPLVLALNTTKVKKAKMTKTVTEVSSSDEEFDNDDCL